MTAFTHRNPGDPVILAAAEINQWNDSSRRSNDISTGSINFSFDSVIVEINNTTGSNLSRFEVVGLSGPTFLPSSNLDTFVGRIFFDAVTPTTPTYRGKFGVVLNAIPSGAMGKAMVAGVVPCKVNVSSADHTHAEIANSTRTYLASKFHGSAQILWKESGTGEKWALIGIGRPPEPRVIPCKVEKTSGSAGSATAAAEFVYTVRSMDWNGTSGGVVWGTNIPYAQPRTKGLRIAQSGSQGIGYGYFDTDGTTFRLLNAGEIDDSTTEC